VRWGYGRWTVRAKRSSLRETVDSYAVNWVNEDMLLHQSAGLIGCLPSNLHLGEGWLDHAAGESGGHT
jgi:hypothetical protein